MVKVHSLDGKAKGEAELSTVFATPYRPDIIQRASVALNSSIRQRHAADPLSGLRTSGDYFGSRRRSYRQTINKGITRLPRVKTGGGGLGKVVRIPQATGGRKAHPPVGKEYMKKINKKERKLAIHSAAAATAEKKIVLERGHKIGDAELPYIVEDRIQDIKKTKDLLKTLEILGFKEELSTKKKKKILIVVEKDNGIMYAGSNIDGVDIVSVEGLDIDLLAPGAKAGRLTIWGESAAKNLR
jgi:large subunit ribosomal protein L4e